MDKSLLIFLLLCYTIATHAQVKSLSSPLLNGISGYTQNIKTLEVEANLLHFRSSRIFTNKGKVLHNQAVSLDSKLIFRTSYGLGENLEIGLSFNGEIDNIQGALKYHLIGSDNFNLGIISAYNFEVSTQSTLPSNLTNNFNLGLSSDYKINSKFFLTGSIDIQNNKRLDGSNVYGFIDLGYSARPQLLAVIEIAYSSTVNILDRSILLSLNPALIHSTKHYELTLAGIFNVAGKNIPLNVGGQLIFNRRL